MPPADALVSIVVLGLVCTALAFVVFSALIVEVGPGRALGDHLRQPGRRGRLRRRRSSARARPGRDRRPAADPRRLVALDRRPAAARACGARAVAHAVSRQCVWSRAAPGRSAPRSSGACCAIPTSRCGSPTSARRRCGCARAARSTAATCACSTRRARRCAAARTSSTWPRSSAGSRTSTSSRTR